VLHYRPSPQTHISPSHRLSNSRLPHQLFLLLTLSKWQVLSSRSSCVSDEDGNDAGSSGSGPCLNLISSEGVACQNAIAGAGDGGSVTAEGSLSFDSATAAATVDATAANIPDTVSVMASDGHHHHHHHHHQEQQQPNSHRYCRYVVLNCLMQQVTNPKSNTTQYRKPLIFSCRTPSVLRSCVP
jgi:hypothetical protein